jgi:hypothetical protein
MIWYFQWLFVSIVTANLFKKQRQCSNSTFILFIYLQLNISLWYNIFWTNIHDNTCIELCDLMQRLEFCTLRSGDDKRVGGNDQWDFGSSFICQHVIFFLLSYTSHGFGVDLIIQQFIRCFNILFQKICDT